MKIVILAGGLGTRISEESLVIPKPLIEIGGRPLPFFHVTHGTLIIQLYLYLKVHPHMWP